MICSEARLAANRLNGDRSRGPTTPEGKAISRRNGLKHGLTGQGVVTPEGDADEIEARVEALTADMKPKSPAGVLLIAQMATLSVRTERAVEQESAMIARNIRHAADDFDEERIERANELFAALGDDPRNNLRKLRKMPEGVELLMDAWRDLRHELTTDPTPAWTASHLERAANLSGLKAQHARGSRLGALSRGVWGDFEALGVGEGDDLDEEFRKEWAKAGLLERIDAEIAALEEHYESLDFETIELDRAEAGARALFDPSKAATLARRYESEASRGFFKALKEFRQVEAESEARVESVPAEPLASKVGSSCESSSAPDRTSARTLPTAPPVDPRGIRQADHEPLRSVPTVKTSG